MGKGAMQMEKKQNKSFITGAMVIAFSHIIVKLIGALFRIPLANMIHPEGMAIYQASYSIYLVLFVISTAGLPVAISKLVSKNAATGNRENVQKILKVSFCILCVLGVAGTLLLMLGAKSFAALMKIPEDYIAIEVLAPSLFFVSIASVFRGYFQGYQNMYPTALSEVVESLFKLFVGLLLASALMPMGHAYAASGGILGVTTGSMFSVFFLIAYYLFHRRKQAPVTVRFEQGEFLRILKRVIWIAIPITIGSSVFSLTNMIDAAMIMRRLAGLGYSETAYKMMYGYYSGYAITLFNLPATVIVGMSISIVPAVSVALANRDLQQAKEQIASSLRLSWQIAFPAGIGLAVLASPILHLLYRDTDFILPMNATLPLHPVAAFFCNNQDGTRLLSFLGLAIGMVCVTMVTNAVLQALDKVWLPVRNMLIGGVVKVVANYVLIGIPAMNIMGAPISTTLCYGTILCLNLLSIHRTLPVHYGFGNTVLKPLIAAVAMSFAGYYSYWLFSGRLAEVLAVGFAICLAAAVYFLTMLLLRGFRKSDVELMPKGKRLASVLEKFLS